MKEQRKDGRLSALWEKHKNASLIYPDGRTVGYEYDTFGRLAEMKEDDNIIRYRYDELGRLAEKSFPTECFFKLKSGEIIGFEVGYYLKKDINAFNWYILENTGIEFQKGKNKVGSRGK